MKKAATAVMGLALLFASLASSLAGEISERAVALQFEPAFSLNVLHVLIPGKDEIWEVSGFAPGVGLFSKNVKANDVGINFAGGTASVKTTVVTSLGFSVPINVTWTAMAGVVKTGTRPSGSAALDFTMKPATVSGSIGALTLGTGAVAEISQRKMVP